MFTATNHDSFLDPLPPTASLDARRQAAEAIFDWIKVTGAEVDGVAIEDLTSYRVVSPPYKSELAAGQHFRLPGGRVRADVLCWVLCPARSAPGRATHDSLSLSVLLAAGGASLVSG
jgi:hypothetical protein